MKKKILALTASAVLAVSSLTACGSENSSSGSTESGNSEKVTITNVSYDPTRELYAAYNKVFAQH